jgi:hypothetical protein
VTPAGVCTRALLSRLLTSWCSRAWSPRTQTGSSGRSLVRRWVGAATAAASHWHRDARRFACAPSPPGVLSGCRSRGDAPAVARSHAAQFPRAHRRWQSSSRPGVLLGVDRLLGRNRILKDRRHVHARDTPATPPVTQTSHVPNEKAHCRRSHGSLGHQPTFPPPTRPGAVRPLTPLLRQSRRTKVRCSRVSYIPAGVQR